MADAQKTISPLNRFFRLLQPNTTEIKYLYIFSFLNGIIALSMPLGIQAILGIIVGGQINSSWAILLFVIGLGIIASGTLTYIQQYISEVLQRKLFARAAFDFAFRLPRLRLEVIEKQFAPELVNRFFDVLTLQKGLPKLLIDFTNAVLQIILGLLLLSVYNPIFLILSIFIVITLVLIIVLTSRQGLETSIYESKYKYKIVSWLEELARAVHTFKLAGDSPLPIQKTDELLTNYLTYRKKHFRILRWQYGTFILFRALVTVALLGVGSYLVIENSINLGQFVAAELIIILVLTSAEKIINTMETVYDVLTAVDKIGYVTDIPIEKNSGEVLDASFGQKGLSLRATNLNFTATDTIDLRNINFIINANERVAITSTGNGGGSGKSILLQIIAGLYTEYTGVMAYNDITIKNLNVNSLRTYIGNFSKKETIFEGTLLHNITLGSTDLTAAQIREIVTKVGLIDFVEQLPEGLETMLLPLGQQLSQNMIQKIRFARALAHQPQLLVVDNYERLQEACYPINVWDLLPANTTVVVVTNDPNIIKNCTQVFHLENGVLTTK